MEYDTKMFAEYEGMQAGRNILEKRPGGKVSSRNLLLNSFIQGLNEKMQLH
jgi:hypothetical protein